MSEKLSSEDLDFLMDLCRQTYTDAGGAQVPAAFPVNNTYCRLLIRQAREANHLRDEITDMHDRQAEFDKCIRTLAARVLPHREVWDEETEDGGYHTSLGWIVNRLVEMVEGKVTT